MANEKKDGLIRDIINKVRCMYSVESGMVKHIENGLQKATNVALDNLLLLITTAIREAKRSSYPVDIEIAKNGADQYYVDQLKKIKTDGEYAPSVKFGGNTSTNWMTLNLSSAAVLIQWLKAEFKINDTYVVVQDVDDIAFVGSYRECKDYTDGNSKDKLRIKTVADWKSGG